MRALAVLALASLPSLVFAQSTPAAPSPTSPAAAAAAAAPMATYHSDALHLTYSYPSAYTDASSMVGPAFEASMSNQTTDKDAMRCVTLPFSVMNNAGSELAMVLLVRADAGCMKKTFTPAQLPEFTQGEVQGLSASGAHTQFGEHTAFTTGGHSADMLRGTFDLPTGQKLHAMVACVLLQPDVACWQFLASSEENLRAMTSFPLTLQGGQPAPLIPAAVLGKP